METQCKENKVQELIQKFNKSTGSHKIIKQKNIVRLDKLIYEKAQRHREFNVEYRFHKSFQDMFFSIDRVGDTYLDAHVTNSIMTI